MFKYLLKVLGGGGYTVKNVARCWALETATVLDIELENDLPVFLNPNYLEYFAPDFVLRPKETRKIDNQNNQQYITKVKNQALQNLKMLEFAPSVQMFQIPPDFLLEEFDYNEEDPEIRFSVCAQEENIENDMEFYDNDDY